MQLRAGDILVTHGLDSPRQGTHWKVVPVQKYNDRGNVFNYRLERLSGARGLFSPLNLNVQVQHQQSGETVRSGDYLPKMI